MTGAFNEKVDVTIDCDVAVLMVSMIIGFIGPQSGHNTPFLLTREYLFEIVLSVPIPLGNFHSILIMCSLRQPIILGKHVQFNS